MHQFFACLGVTLGLTKEVPFRQRNGLYSIGETLLAFLYPVLLGLERLERTELLTRDGRFRTLTGLRTYPNATTLRRFLVRRR